MRALSLLVLAGCCGQEPPDWLPLDPVAVSGATPLEVDLAAALVDDKGAPTIRARAEEGVSVVVQDGALFVTAEPGFEGWTRVALEAEDACGNTATTNLSVEVVDNAPAGTECPTTLTWTGSASRVAVAGTFNDWSDDATPMEDVDGTWTVTLDLAPGAYPYKLVVDGAWQCDPAADFAHCDDGQAWDDMACAPGGNSCNSLLVVPGCDAPVLTVDTLAIDRDGNGVTVSGSASSTPSNPWATLDGEAIDAWDGATFSFAATGLSDGRHTLRFGADGAETAYVPFWLDDGAWETGVLYFAFVDRFANGDTSNDTPEGADVDYAGGDWQGVIDRLDYLDEMGVTALWLTAPWDNAEGPWGGSCGATYSAYHGYWPDSAGLEEHFGDEAKLRELVDAAHARNMRVMVDWVANHVHDDHAWVTEHPEWFNPRYICEEDEDGDGVSNWNQRTETCWFASYLPDLDYTEVDPLVTMVDDAVAFAKDYELDGYRVDAVKHMPHAVVYNLQSRILGEIEHRDAGGDEDFRTIGETFDGASTIAAYVGERELDSQFDFPLYWQVVAAFARDEAGLSNGDGSLKSTLDASRGSYGGALMSPFLGNHDVARFIAHASGEIASLYGDGACDSEGALRDPDVPPGWSEPYDRLMLAWTFLFATEGLPLVYYGDEIGLPGYADPDNRQPMRFGDDLSVDEARVLDHVRALGQARRAHPAMAVGTRTEWWENEADFWAWARVYEDDAVIVLLNRSDVSRTVGNGLAFAGLPQGTWEDLLTGDVFTSAGDSLTVDVPARGSRVLAPR